MVYRRRHGFALIELLAALVMVAIVMAGVMATFIAQSRSHLRQDIEVGVEQDLRIATMIVGDVLRNAGAGVPASRLSSWIPWVSGFTTNPRIVDAGVTDSLSIAACTAEPVATLALAAAQGATSLVATSSASGVLNAGSRRLILIDGSEHAHVTSVSGTIVNIDTNPDVSGAQGLRRARPAGTPICRVDVTTFAVQTSPEPHFTRDLHQGAGPEPLVDNVREFEVQEIAAGRDYALTLMSRSIAVEPATGNHVERRLRRTLSLRN